MQQVVPEVIGYARKRKRRLLRRSATGGASFLGLIAVLGAISIECPAFGIIGWPSVIFLAVLAVLCIATIIAIPLAYLLY